jgi:hypothetical protein
MCKDKVWGAGADSGISKVQRDVARELRIERRNQDYPHADGKNLSPVRRKSTERPEKTKTRPVQAVLTS